MSSQTSTAQETGNDQAVSQGQPAKKQVRSKKSASAFRTISEVADFLDVQQHVLRFWETKFTQVRPLKRGGGRRYYRPEDVELLSTIHHLLYTEGYTIKGVQKLLKEQGKNRIMQNNMPEAETKSAPVSEPAPAPSPSVPAVQEQAKAQSALSSRNEFLLESILGDLKDLRALLVAGE